MLVDVAALQRENTAQRAQIAELLSTNASLLTTQTSLLTTQTKLVAVCGPRVLPVLRRSANDRDGSESRGARAARGAAAAVGADAAVRAA